MAQYIFPHYLYTEKDNLVHSLDIWQMIQHFSISSTNWKWIHKKEKTKNKTHKVKSIADFVPVDPMINREWCVYEQEKLPKIGNGVKQKKKLRQVS